VQAYNLAQNKTFSEKKSLSKYPVHLAKENPQQ